MGSSSSVEAATQEKSQVEDVVGSETQDKAKVYTNIITDATSSLAYESTVIRTIRSLEQKSKDGFVSHKSIVLDLKKKQFKQEDLKGVFEAIKKLERKRKLVRRKRSYKIVKA